MFPHLMGMKEFHRLSNEDMAAVIGTSRQTFENKIRSGSFTPEECKAFCSKFGVGFDYLFATMPEIRSAYGIAGAVCTDADDVHAEDIQEDAGVRPDGEAEKQEAV